MLKWGEIDIILKKKSRLHFVEVKTVSCVTLDSVSYETHNFRPEDNLHPRKLQRLGRTIQSFLLENKCEDIDWQLDGVIVYLDTERLEAKVKIIENIII